MAILATSCRVDVREAASANRQAPPLFRPNDVMGIKHIAQLDESPLVLSMSSCIQALRMDMTLPPSLQGDVKDIVSKVPVKTFGLFARGILKQHDRIMRIYQHLVAMSIHLHHGYAFPRPLESRQTATEKRFFNDCEYIASRHGFEIKHFDSALYKWYNAAVCLQRKLSSLFEALAERAIHEPEVKKVHGSFFVWIDPMSNRPIHWYERMNYNIFENIGNVILDIEEGISDHR